MKKGTVGGVGTPTERIPTELDNIMAGRLSTIWPLSGAHPQDSVHIAIFVNNLMRAAMKTINEQQEEIERLKAQEDRSLSDAEHYIAELENEQQALQNDVLSLQYDIETRDEKIERLEKLAFGEEQSDW